MEKKPIIDEKTLIPVGAITLIFAASMWLTSIWKQGDANASEIQDVKANQARDNDRIYEKLDKMDEKIDKIAEKIMAK